MQLIEISETTELIVCIAATPVQQSNKQTNDQNEWMNEYNERATSRGKRKDGEKEMNIFIVFRL